MQKFFLVPLTSIVMLSCAVWTNQDIASAKPAAKSKAKAAQTLARRPLYVAGRVLTMQNKPLSNVEIGIFGTTARGDRTRFEARTDASGQYSLRVPDGIYGVAAYYDKTFNGKNYRFTLHPEDGISSVTHDAATGIVKNFRWKISGLKPGQRPGETGSHTETLKYYGGYVYVTSKEEGTLVTSTYFPAGSTLVMNLTPRTKLIDGSTGQTRSFRRTFPADILSSIGWHLTDIPIGLYKLSATLLSPDGTRKPLNTKSSGDFNDPFTPSINLNFEPTSFGDMQMVQVTVEP